MLGVLLFADGFMEAVDAVDVGFDCCADDVGVGGEAVVDVVVVLDLDVDFAGVVASFADALYGELFEGHGPVDDVLECVEGGIDGAVACGGGCELLSGNVEKVADFNVIVVDSEFESLVLENSLIKQHQPHYNILLKDDKGIHRLAAAKYLITYQKRNNLAITV